MGSAAFSRRALFAGFGAAAATAILPATRVLAAPDVDEASRAEAWRAARFIGAGGEAMRLGEVGAGVVAVHVWASWCAACLGELTPLQDFAERLAPAGLATVLVSHPKHWERDAAFIKRAGIRLRAYTLAPDAPWEAREAIYDIRGGSYSVPRTLVFAGRQRRCVFAKDGPEDWRSPQLASRLRTLLG